MFFFLGAAWVNPGRIAPQSANQKWQETLWSSYHCNFNKETNKLTKTCRGKTNKRGERQKQEEGNGEIPEESTWAGDRKKVAGADANCKQTPTHLTNQTRTKTNPSYEKRFKAETFPDETSLGNGARTKNFEIKRWEVCATATRSNMWEESYKLLAAMGWKKMDWKEKTTLTTSELVQVST